MEKIAEKHEPKPLSKFKQAVALMLAIITVLSLIVFWPRPTVAVSDPVNSDDPVSSPQ